MEVICKPATHPQNPVRGRRCDSPNATISEMSLYSSRPWLLKINYIDPDISTLNRPINVQ